MTQHKRERVQETLKAEIGSIIHTMKDPRIGFASVVRTEVSQDLRFARVFVSVLGDNDSKTETMEVLERAKGFIRSELGKRVKLRFVPEVCFRLDDSIEHGDRIARLLKEASVSSGGEETEEN